MSLVLVIFLLGTGGLAGFFLATVFQRMTTRYKLDELCRRELQRQVDHYQNRWKPLQ